MNTTRTLLASLAGLALSVGTARADLITGFDLDENGSKESSVTSRKESIIFINLATWTIKNGHKDKAFGVVWGGNDFSGKIAKAGAAGKPSLIRIEQSSQLSAKERKVDVTWESGGKKFEGRANTHILSVDNEKRIAASVSCDVSSGDGLGDLVTRLVFKSVIQDGVITHTVENKTDAKVTVDWAGTEVKGEIEVGKSLTATRKAPNGATERKSLASFDPTGAGLDGGIIKATVNYFSPAGNVPTPGTLTLAGFAGALATGRRRRPGN